MRIARLLAVLCFLATSSTALAATQAIKFGKLSDGTGRIFTNAVVIVEDDRVHRKGKTPRPGSRQAEAADRQRKQEAFLAAFTEHATISGAAKIAHVGRRTHYA